MEKIQFKTTIKCSGCVAQVTPFLNEAVGAGNWAVNTADPDKILTVSAGRETDEEKILKAVRDAGYKAEKMV